MIIIAIQYSICMTILYFLKYFTSWFVFVSLLFYVLCYRLYASWPVLFLSVINTRAHWFWYDEERFKLLISLIRVTDWKNTHVFFFSHALIQSSWLRWRFFCSSTKVRAKYFKPRSSNLKVKQVHLNRDTGFEHRALLIML